VSVSLVSLSKHAQQFVSKMESKNWKELYDKTEVDDVLVDMISKELSVVIREWFNTSFDRGDLVKVCHENDINRQNGDYHTDALHDYCDPNEAVIQVCQTISEWDNGDEEWKYVDLHHNMLDDLGYMKAIELGWRKSREDNFGVGKNQYWGWNEDALGDEKYELEEHIVNDWVSSVELESDDECNEGQKEILKKYKDVLELL